MLMLPLLQASPSLSCNAGCQHEYQAASLLQDRRERSRQPLPALENEERHAADLNSAPGLSVITIIHDPEPPDGAGGPGADDVVIAKAGDMVIAKGGNELGVADAVGEKPTYVVIVPRFDHPRTPRSEAPMQVYGDDSGTGWWLNINDYTVRDALTFFEYFLMFLFVVYGIRNLTHKPPPSRPLDPQFGEDSFSVQSDSAFSRGLVTSTPPAPPSTAAAVAPPAEYQRPTPSEQAGAHPMEAMPMPPAHARAPVPFEPVAPMSRAALLRVPAPPLAFVPARKQLMETVLVPTPSALAAWPQGCPLEPRSQSPPPVVRSVTRSLSPGRVIQTTTRSWSPPRQLAVAQPVVVRSFEALPPAAPLAPQLSPRMSRTFSQPLTPPPSAPLAALQPPSQALSQLPALSQPSASEAIEPVVEPMTHS